MELRNDRYRGSVLSFSLSLFLSNARFAMRVVVTRGRRALRLPLCGARARFLPRGKRPTSAGNAWGK